MIMESGRRLTLFFLLTSEIVLALQSSGRHDLSVDNRRGFFNQLLLSSTTTAATIIGSSTAFARPAFATTPSALGTPNLQFITAPSGLQYADAKIGTGEPLTSDGANVVIDYVMSTSGARYGSKIYSTTETNSPYRFRLGYSGSTIVGLEDAIRGGKGIEPMRPGGIRRIIVPSSLAYESLAKPIPGMQFQDCQEGRGVGPIPPVGEGTAGEYYQRFKNIYCNANRPYQPDLVMDVKLYGKR